MGGVFSSIGGKFRNGFAVLDAITGEAVDEGLSFPARASVVAVAVNDSIIYLSGDHLGKEVTPMIRLLGGGYGFGGYDRTSGELRWLPKYPVPTNTQALGLQLSASSLTVSGVFNRQYYGALAGQWDSSNNGMMRLDLRTGEVLGDWPLVGGEKFLEWEDTLLVLGSAAESQQGVKMPYLALLTHQGSSGVATLGRRYGGPLRVYPNPSKGTITVERGEGCGKEVEVVNMYGEVIQRTEHDEGGSIIELSSISDGVYVVRSGSQSAAIVIQR